MKYVAVRDLRDVAKKGGVVTRENCDKVGVSFDALLRGRLIRPVNPKKKTAKKGKG